MDTRRSKNIAVASGIAVLDKNGVGSWQWLHRALERLLGESNNGSGSVVNASSTQSDEMADLPREIACATEKEAVALCESMIARGFVAVVHYDIYDYSWSVEIRAALAAPGDSTALRDAE